VTTSQITGSLTTGERSVLIILMAEGGQADADTLGSVLGTPVPDRVYRRLQRAGLIDVVKVSARRYGTALTEDGWYWCSQELSGPGPRPAAGEPFAGALYAVMNTIDRYLEATGMGIAEFMTIARAARQGDAAE
jgi:hypothetical protein